MRIEIFKRLWVSDKNMNLIQNVVNVQKKIRKIYDVPNIRDRQNAYADYLYKIIQFIYYQTVIQQKSIILIDPLIHERNDAYIICIAYFMYYGKLEKESVINNLYSKTPKFNLSIFSLETLDLFQSKY
jgi:hypothetical protein